MIQPSQRRKLFVFVLLVSGLALALLLLFARERLFQFGSTYYVRVPDGVSGIQKGSPVTVRGVHVGAVDAVELYADDYQSVRLALDIDGGVPINRDAHATLSLAGVTGLKVVDISGGSGKKGQIAPGGYIPYRQSTLQRVGSEAEELVAQARALLATTNQLVGNVARISAGLDAERIEAMLASAQHTLATYDSAGSELRSLLRESRPPLRRTLGAADAALRGSDGLGSEASEAIAGLNAAATELHGMVRENEGNLRAITYNLREASQSFRQLARELRQRPSRLLVSGAPPERELP